MRDLLICLCLVAATVAAYWPVHRFEFVHFDDDRYVYENPRVSAGLTRQNIAWAWGSPQIANYHPLTLMSLQLDAALFGLRAGPYHVENLLWHIVAVLLLFNVWRAATGDTWPPAFVAAIFALHPTHVESVAWVSERKDVFSAIFMFSAMRAYIMYCRNVSGRKWACYALMLVLFAMGLLAKSMIVTLPALLLPMDFWPLRRLAVSASWRGALIEKTPLLGLSLLASVAAYKAQHVAGLVASLQAVPLHVRLTNVAVSYVRYLGITFWPARLSPYYPYRADWSVAQISVSLALLLALTIAFISQSRRRPYLLVGWFWFLVAMLPVIGFVQVGSQSIADRYLYLPMVGLSLMIAWGAKDLVVAARSPGVRQSVAVAGVAIAVTMAVLTRQQVWSWRDTRTFFEHALLMVNGNAVAHVRLGAADARDGNHASAAAHYLQALNIEPHNWTASFNYGNLLLKDQPAAAIEQYRRAADDAPDAPSAAQVQNNWANALLAISQPGEAFEHFRIAERLDPEFFDPHYNLGQLLFRAGQYDAAAVEFRQALRINPDHAGAQRALAAASETGRAIHR